MCIARQSCHPSRWLLVLNSLIVRQQLWQLAKVVAQSGLAQMLNAAAIRRRQFIFYWITPFPWTAPLHFLSLHLPHSVPLSSHTHTQYTNSLTLPLHQVTCCSWWAHWWSAESHGCNHLDSNWSFSHKEWICPQTHLWLHCMYTVWRGSICLKLTSQGRNTLANPPTVASTS